MRRLLPIGLLAGALVLAGAPMLAGCGGSGNGRTDANYCATVNRHLVELNSPTVSTPADVAKAVALYSTVSKVAPLAVEKEWDELAIAYQTAATVDPADQASMQRAADMIRGAQQSANAAADYTMRLCNVQIGPSTVPTTLLSESPTTIKGARPAAP